MAATASPYGFRPVGKLGGRYTGNRRMFVVASNNTAAMYNGDLLEINSGLLSTITASPTTTRSTTAPVGVMVGCSYDDPVFGHQERQYLPASSITSLGYTNVRVYVEDDPDTIFQVQADGTVPLTSIGLNAAVILTTAGSTVTGDSGQTINHTAATTNTLAMKIIDLVNAGSSTGGTSTPSDAYTDCLVVFNAGVHVYRQVLGG